MRIDGESAYYSIEARTLIVLCDLLLGAKYATKSGEICANCLEQECANPFEQVAPTRLFWV